MLRRRPLRVVVTGNSIAFFLRPPRAHRDEGHYAEVLEDLLAEAGVPARVTSASRWFMLVTEAFRRFEDIVTPHHPDVVVMNFGLLECEPKIMPTRTLKWLYTWKPGGSRWARLVRSLVVRPLQKAYRLFAPTLIRLLPVPRRVGPGRFRLEMARFVRVVRKERGALVLLCAVNPPGPALEATLPGTAEGARRYTAILEDVAAADDQVRVVRTDRLVESEGVDELLPDGIHYNARGHRLVAELLRDEILAWLGERRAAGR